MTGSTSGIGWALALQFAKRGLNLVLHGRSEDQLKGKLKTVQDLYPKVEAKLLLLQTWTSVLSRDTLRASRRNSEAWI